MSKNLKASWNNFISNGTITAYIEYAHARDAAQAEANAAYLNEVAAWNARANTLSALLDRWNRQAPTANRAEQRQKIEEEYESHGVSFPHPDGRTVDSTGVATLGPYPDEAKTRMSHRRPAITDENGQAWPKDYESAVKRALKEAGVQ